MSNYNLVNFEEIGIDAHISNLVGEAKNLLTYADRMKGEKMIQALDEIRRLLEAAVISHNKQDYVYPMSISDLIV